MPGWISQLLWTNDSYVLPTLPLLSKWEYLFKKKKRKEKKRKEMKETKQPMQSVNLDYILVYKTKTKRLGYKRFWE